MTVSGEQKHLRVLAWAGCASVPGLGPNQRGRLGRVPMAAGVVDA